MVFSAADLLYLSIIMFNRNMLVQAIFAVLKVTPHIARLSEQVLSDGIMLFFQQQKMIPLGISMDCVGALAGKMACGLRKCVTKFKRTLKDAPQTSKLKNLTNLKQRLQKLPPQLDHAECDSQVSADSVEMLLDAAVPGNPEGVLEKAAAAKPKLDWATLTAKCKAFRDAKAAASQQDRPVATPARSKHMLPAHVLDSLKQTAEEAKCLVPFSTVKDDAQDMGGSTEEALPKPAPKRKAKKTSAKGKKNSKKKGGDDVGPEEEAALAVPLSDGLSAAAVPGDQEEDTTYVPGDFQKKGWNLSGPSGLRTVACPSGRHRICGWEVLSVPPAWPRLHLAS
jgi:hypothetical protein